MVLKLDRPPDVADHRPRVTVPALIYDPREVRSALGRRRDVTGASFASIIRLDYVRSPIQTKERAMIRVRATEDGTYTVYRDRTAIVCGLNREQADEFVRSLGMELA